MGAVSGVLLALSWASIGLVVGELPDLDSQAEVEGFFAANAEKLKLVIGCVSVGFLFFLGYLGALVERLRSAQGSEPLARTAFASALMFMTLFNAAVGLDAAAGLLYGSSSPEFVHALHTAAFVLAAPAAFVGVAFFAAIALLALSIRAVPRWLGWLAVAAAIANLGAIGGVFATEGPLNSGNGLLGGIVVPLFAWVAWIFADSLAALRTTTPHRSRAPRPLSERPLAAERGR